MFQRFVSCGLPATSHWFGNRLSHDPRNRHAPPRGELHRDLCVLVEFVEFYCAKKHKHITPKHLLLRSHDMEQLAGHPVSLCDHCAKLLTHALVKRSHCPFDPKPPCKHCPQHCYHPKYRQQIQEVMRFSGKGLIIRGRFDLLAHWMF